MNKLSYYDWLWIAGCSINGEELSCPKRILLRMIIKNIEPKHRNDFNHLELVFTDELEGRKLSLFYLTWSQYCDYLGKVDASIDGRIEWIFEGKREGSSIRRNGGEAKINAAWWYERTGADPLGVFSDEELRVLEETFAEPVKAETREQVIEWLEKIIDESNKGNERR